MKRFYGSIFIGKEKLEEAGINNPIKLEYYKIINENEEINEEKSKFGIKIVKTQYLENDTIIEDETIKHISNNSERVDQILEILKTNEVTPICLQDIVNDLSYIL